MSRYCANKQRLIFQLNWNWQAGALASARTGWQGRAARAAGGREGGSRGGPLARRPYLACLRLRWRIASEQSAGTHLSAITQNSSQGGRPVYSTSSSKL
jgi:hypothetical protein